MTFGKLENKYTYKCESHINSEIPAGVLLNQTFEGRFSILTHLDRVYCIYLGTDLTRYSIIKYKLKHLVENYHKNVKVDE